VFDWNDSRSRNLDGGIDIDLSSGGSDGHEKCIANVHVVPSVKRFFFPPASYGVDCDGISASELGARATPVIGVQRARIPNGS
jgi:hypothetical protein